MSTEIDTTIAVEEVTAEDPVVIVATVERVDVFRVWAVVPLERTCFGFLP